MFINRHPLRHRMVRRGGLSGLGDYSQWLSNLSITDENGTRISFASASPAEQAQIINATAGTAYFGQPAGAAISIQVKSTGGTNDIPAYTLTGGIGGGTQSLPYLANRAGQIVGQEITRAANILHCGQNNCTPGAQTGPLLTSSLPANFQDVAALPTQAQAAAVFPTVISSNSVPLAVAAGSSALNVSTASSGIPTWVWLLGGGVLLWFLFAGGKNK